MSMKMKTIAWLVNRDDPVLWASVITNTLRDHPGCFRIISDETGLRGIWLMMKVGGVKTELDTANGTLTIHRDSGTEECPLPEKPRNTINLLVRARLTDVSDTPA